MPVREKRRETIAGLFVLIGLLLLAGLIVEFGRIGGTSKDRYSLFVQYPDTAGIIKNSEIRLRGAKVGRVANTPELIILDDDSHVEMELLIREDVKIPTDSIFQIGSSGLLGDKYIDIIPPEVKSDSFYEPGAMVIGDSSGDFDAIKSDAESIAREASIIMKDAKVTIDKMNGTLDSIKSTSDSLNMTITKVNEGILSDKNLIHITTIMENFESSSNRFDTASQDLQPTLAEVKLTVTQARETLAGIQNSTQSALSEMPKAIQSIESAATKAEQTISSFQNKDSLAGTLTNDKATGDNAKDFLKNLKRYGILRYRDDDSPETNDPRNKYRGSRR